MQPVIAAQAREIRMIRDCTKPRGADLEAANGNACDESRINIAAIINIPTISQT